MIQRQQYTPYGLWEVTTEGDVEGRSTRNLGTHEGFIDEIAFALAQQCYYALNFKLVEPLNVKKQRLDNTRKTVTVALDIDSGTWDLRGEQLVEYWQDLLRDRGITVLRNSTYAGVEIVKRADAPAIIAEREAKQAEQDRREEQREQQRRDEERQRQLARNKLSARERDLLGLK